MSDPIFTIAVISDLHCKPGNLEAKEYNSTYLYSDLLSKPVLQHPVEALKKLIISEDLKVNAIVCPGDIADKMNVQGLVSGWKYLEEINALLKSKLLISTVGNHDVNSFQELPFGFNHYVQNLNDQFPFSNSEFDSLLQNEINQQFWSKNNFFIYENEKSVFLVYNTCHNHHDKTQAKESCITDPILEAMEDRLKRFAVVNKIKIAVLHHHPKAFSNLNQIYKDGDVLKGGDKFISLLIKEKFDLIIHGHKHIPRLEYDESLPIFCSGSFSSRMNVADWPRGMNTFHVIDFYKDIEGNQASSKARGVIRTWEFAYSAGWKMTRNPDAFFPAFTGFGNPNRDIQSFAKRINLWFKKEITGKAKNVATYQQIKSEFPDIEFLNPNEQNEISDYLISNFSLEFSPHLTLGSNILSPIYKNNNE